MARQSNYKAIVLYFDSLSQQAKQTSVDIILEWLEKHGWFVPPPETHDFDAIKLTHLKRARGCKLDVYVPHVDYRDYNHIDFIKLAYSKGLNNLKSFKAIDVGSWIKVIDYGTAVGGNIRLDTPYRLSRPLHLFNHFDIDFDSAGNPNGYHGWLQTGMKIKKIKQEDLKAEFFALAVRKNLIPSIPTAKSNRWGNFKLHLIKGDIKIFYKDKNIYYNGNWLSN